MNQGDYLGSLVYAEYQSWAREHMDPAWTEAVQRDWAQLDETQKSLYTRIGTALYQCGYDEACWDS